MCTAVDTVAVVCVRLAVVLLALLVAACGADESAGGARLVSPQAFAERIDAEGVVTINVHIPDEGTIPGTDLAIPFDRISSSDQLPADLDTPLAVYCRSGNMSADAIEDLEELGYTDIVELEGGFDAWKAEGRTLDAPS